MQQPPRKAGVGSLIEGGDQLGGEIVPFISSADPNRNRAPLVGGVRAIAPPLLNIADDVFALPRELASQTLEEIYAGTRKGRGMSTLNEMSLLADLTLSPTNADQPQTAIARKGPTMNDTGPSLATSGEPQPAIAREGANMGGDVFSNLDALRLSPELVAGAGVKKMLTTIPVRKPSRHDWFRVNPDPEMVLDVLLARDKQDGDDFYLVAPSMVPELGDEVRPYRLHVAVTRTGVVVIWPCALPGEDGKSNPWHASAMGAAEHAKTSWTRMAANKSLGAYELFRSDFYTEDPVWPDKSMSELLRIAFGQQIIETVDHIFVKRIRGQI
jgi:hypothetical protein